MTREILFRGKRLDNGEWIESGSLIRARDEGTGNFLVFLGSAQPAVHIFNRDGNLVSVTSLAECFCCEVDPSTVGQYTGLCDKNGKKIFEGDIVEVTDDFGEISSSDCGYGKVIFLDGMWYIDEDVDNDLFNLNNVYYIEVIGNIHDNPELLEVVG